jgi:Na+-driven multidrug efflux pump
MRDPERATYAGWVAVRLSAIWATFAGVAFIVFTRPLLGIFTSDTAVVDAAVGALTIIALVQPAQAAIFALGGALRGAGDTRFPLIASVVNWLAVRLPLGYVLAFPLGLGLAGVWLAVGVDYVIRAALLVWRFRSGAWQRVRV